MKESVKRETLNVNAARSLGFARIDASGIALVVVTLGAFALGFQIFLDAWA